MSLTLPRVSDGNPFPESAYNEQAAAVEDHEDRLTALEALAGATNSVQNMDNATPTSYTDLANIGPRVTVFLKAGQQALVILSCEAFATTAGARLYMSYAVSGQETVAADDDNAAKKRAATVNDDSTATKITLFTASSSDGNRVFTCKYRIDVGGTGTSWQRRRIVVIPL